MSGGMFSLEWWITAGAAGVAASALGAYVVRWLDRGGGTAIRWFAELGNRRKAARAARINAAKADEHALNRLRIQAVTNRLDGIACLVLAAMLVVLFGVAAVLTDVGQVSGRVGWAVAAAFCLVGFLVGLILGVQRIFRGVNREYEVYKASDSN